MLGYSSTAATAKSLQSCPTLCDPIDGSPPGSPIPGILQARTLEWAAISFSNVWKWKVKVKSLSRVRLLATPWTVAYQAPPSMGFSRQEYWSGVPLPSPVLKFAELFYLCLLTQLIGRVGSIPIVQRRTKNPGLGKPRCLSALRPFLRPVLRLNPVHLEKSSIYLIQCL